MHNRNHSELILLSVLVLFPLIIGLFLQTDINIKILGGALAFTLLVVFLTQKIVKRRTDNNNDNGKNSTIPTGRQKIAAILWIIVSAAAYICFVNNSINIDDYICRNIRALEPYWLPSFLIFRYAFPFITGLYFGYFFKINRFIAGLPGILPFVIHGTIYNLGISSWGSDTAINLSLQTIGKTPIVTASLLFITVSWLCSIAGYMAMRMLIDRNK
ncbi:MAG: hypothetical protein LWY06_12985 [Firmicutes bacterium]|nr:hypothetical protein [Bacillota bacterium]